MEARPSSSGLLDDYYWSPKPSLPSPILWTREQDKIFEHALVIVPENSPNRWILIAGLLPGKSEADVRDHYDALVSDVLNIDSGRVELPSYGDDSVLISSPEIIREEDLTCQLSEKASPSSSERKKGKPWTKKEHQLFLLGLKRFGKGDWRSISRSVVITRTPTQVASHAQKYFLRQESTKKDRKRSSIHDITTVEGGLVTGVATSQSQLNIFSVMSQPSSSSPSFRLRLPQEFAPTNYFVNPRRLDY